MDDQRRDGQACALPAPSPAARADRPDGRNDDGDGAIDERPFRARHSTASPTSIQAAARTHHGEGPYRRVGSSPGLTPGV